MDENYYYEDERNAVFDHRRRPGITSAAPMPVVVPPRPMAAAPAPTVYMPPTATALAPRPMYYQPAHVVPTPPMVAAAPAPSGAASLLAKISTAQLIEIGAQLVAAMQALPAAPVATKDVATDVNNLMLYQAALAQHAKRDEQIRTLGNLAARVAG